jgi:SAGA-associated factor 11
LAVADVASECHRIARLGLDRSVDAEEEELRAWAARAAGDGPGAEDGGASRGTGGGNKGAPDVFGQTHPAIAADVVDCMNCGRPVVAGRFAPHLEKCMGKVKPAVYLGICYRNCCLKSQLSVPLYWISVQVVTFV